MRRLSVLLTLLVVPLLWLGADPAMACSCVVRDVSDQVTSADAVVTGRLTGRDTSRDGMEVVYTFMGLERFKGPVTPGFEVRTASLGASCGLESLQVGRSYMVFMDSGGDAFTANLCGGTRQATPAFVQQVEAVTGPGTSFGGVPPAPESAFTAALRGLASLSWWG